jgi:hypothetical protein
VPRALDDAAAEATVAERAAVVRAHVGDGVEGAVDVAEQHVLVLDGHGAGPARPHVVRAADADVPAHEAT